MRKSIIKTFGGVIDQDSSLRFVKEGNLVYAENVFATAKNILGEITNERSSVLVNYPLPAGVNVCIGVAEDKQRQSIVYFVKNSNGNHRILRWFSVPNRIVAVAAGSYLGLSNRVHSSHVIDGRFVVWTDGFSDAGNITGNEPRMLDMEMSYVDGKALTYKFIAGLPGNGQFKSGDVFEFQIRGLDNTLYETYSVLLTTDDYLGNPAAGFEWLKGELELLDTNDYLQITACDCHMHIEVLSTDTKIVTNLATDVDQYLLVPENHYVASLDAMEPYMIALKREPLDCAPSALYTGVAGVSYNNVRDGHFQFRSRVIYKDGAVSAYSAISMVPDNNSLFGGPQASLNAIRVTYTDERLNDVKWLSMIEAVELVFRDGNTEPFRLLKRIDMCELGVQSQSYLFTNDGQYSVIASDDLSVGDGATQVIANYFPVPRICGAIAPVSSSDGDVRLVLGANKENFDCPSCPEVSVVAGSGDISGLVDIRGVVEIVNDPRAFDTVMRFPNYVLGGFVVYLAGTPYYAVSDNPLDGSGTGEFVIKNVPRGQYSIRVASYMCRYDDSLCPRHNLLNALEWQRTSSPVVDCAGAVAANGFQHERRINLYGFTDPVFDLATEAGYGNIKIQNCHQAAATPGAGSIRLVETYVVDNDGTYDTVDKRMAATSVERRQVQFRIGSTTGFLPAGDPTFPSPIVNCDHNGYAFASIRLNHPGNVDRVRVVLPGWGGDDSGSAQPYHCFAAPNNPDADYLQKQAGWNAISGDFADDYQGNADSNTVLYDIDLSSMTIFCFGSDPAWTLANKATISGTVVDANGVPVQSALAWMITNGRYERSDYDGSFVIATFGVDGGVRNALQTLHVTYPNDAAGNFPPDPIQEAASFNLDNDSDGTADNHDAGTFELGIFGGVPNDIKYLKSGGIYKTAIVYEDEAGRPCGVEPANSLRIPYHTEDGQYIPRTASWSVNSIPPIEAKRFRILRTKDTFFQSYKITPVDGVKYAIIADGAVTPTFTTYSSNNASHVLIKVPTRVSDADAPAGTLLLMFRGPQATGYKSKYGDRVRYLLDQFQQPVFSDRILELDVLGEYVDDDEYYVVIPYTEVGFEILSGFTFEFFTPKGFEEEIFYETGVCLPIIDAGTGTRRHAGITANQDLGAGTPATGDILSGDTYWWREDFFFNQDTAFNIICEHYYRSPFNLGKVEDIGRPFIVDPLFVEKFYEDQIRMSGLYATNTKVNSLNSFGGLDIQTTNRVFGPIKYMGMVHTVLMVLCQNKVQSFYVGKGRIMDVSGQALVGRTDKVLNVADETRIDAGTLNPESVVIEDGMAYWWDAQRGIVWSFGQNGVRDITPGLSRYFYETSKFRIGLARIDDVVVGGYDRKHDYVVFSFQSGQYGNEETGVVNVPEVSLAYSAVENGWKTFFNFHSEAIGRVDNDYVTFKNGRLYRHFVGADYNVFQGAATRSIVQVAVNEGPYLIKDWYAVSQRGSQLWYGQSLFTIPSAEYPSGMSSELPASRWVLQEGVWKADFLGDATDPHQQFLALPAGPTRRANAMLRGRQLKGEVMVITFQLFAPVVPSSLSWAKFEVGDSQVT